MALQATFANAAARIAYSVDPVYDLGIGVLQLDTNTVYRAIRGGAGADCWEARYVLDDLTKTIELSLNDVREVDANTDISNIAANGGLLASDTTPILRGDAAESWEISWATGNADIIALQKALPFDFSGASDVTVQLMVSSGSTDAASFTVESGWDGAALVSDSVDDSATKSATKHNVTATIAAADIPDTARYLTLILTPPAHATNAIQIHGIRLLYERARVA
jgi:hypothetical protein